MRPLLVSALALALAGCGGAERALDRVSVRSAPPSERTFELPEPYEILDVRYGSALVALDEDPDPWDVHERTTVQVFARHRTTGEETLFVYDLTRSGTAPVTTVRFRRVPEAVEAEPAPDRRGGSWSGQDG
jgi:hypothetical protein